MFFCKKQEIRDEDKNDHLCRYPNGKIFIICLQTWTMIPITLSPYLPAHDGYLRVIIAATTADLGMPSMAAEYFTYLLFQAVVRFEPATSLRE